MPIDCSRPGKYPGFVTVVNMAGARKTGDSHRHGRLLLVKSPLRPGVFPVPEILPAGT